MSPIYEFICPKCEEKFEQRKSMAERHFGECKCGNKCFLIPSTFNAWISSPFTKDGPGFQTVQHV